MRIFIFYPDFPKYFTEDLFKNYIEYAYKQNPNI